MMPFYPLGNLETLMRNTQENMGGNAIKTVSSQTLEALKWLHSHTITHRDVKPDNIMIQSRSPFVTKLGDLGFAITAETALSKIGTYKYAAPEVLYNATNLPYSNKVDIWSLSHVILRLLGIYLPCRPSETQEAWDRGVGLAVERALGSELDTVRIKALRSARRMADYDTNSRPSALKL